MDLAAYLDQRRRLVDQALDEALARLSGLSPTLKAAMGHSLLAGGKRLRPILLLAAAQLAGAGWKGLLPAAVGLEMVHTATLIHDDLPIMDDDDFRRGRPTCHQVFGPAAALMAGDALLTQGPAMFLECPSPPAALVRALKTLLEALGPAGVAAGQVLDIEAEGTVAGLDQVRAIHMAKTARLIAAACGAGAILGGADEKTEAALFRYGTHTGLAFQIVDDILDIEGETAVLGKQAGMDQIRGKATYPQAVGIEESWRVAAGQVDMALAAIAGLGPAAEPLAGLAAYFIERRK